MADFMTNIKTVSRQDLFHDDALSADGDEHHPIDDDDEAAAARAALEALLMRDLGLDLTESVSTKPAPEAEEPAPASDGTAEFSFRLFSSSSTKKTGKQGPAGAEAATPTVVLADDTVDVGEGGLVNSPRPLSTYIADAPTSEQLAQYAVTAVDGAEVRAQAAADRRNAWGWEVPWRARTVVRVTKSELRELLSNALPTDAAAARTSTALLGSLTAQAANALPRWAMLPSSSGLPPVPQDTPSHKCRPGKKRRILLRQRQKARAEKEAAAQAQLQTKEEHLQEKKKRLNRLKKLRRREKKREEKTTGGSQGGGDGNSSDDLEET